MRIGSRTGTKQRTTFALHARGSRIDQGVSRHAAPAIRYTARAARTRKRYESRSVVPSVAPLNLTRRVILMHQEVGFGTVRCTHELAQELGSSLWGP